MKREQPREYHPADYPDTSTELPRWFWVVGPLVAIFFSAFGGF